MITVEAKIEGVSPLLMNPKTMELLEELRTGVRKPKLRDKSLEEECDPKVIRKDGVIGIPDRYLFSCLVQAGRKVKYDSRSFMSTAASTLIPIFLEIKEDFFPITPSDWVADIQGGVNPHGGEAVAIVRPRFDKWGFTVVIEIDDKEIAEEKVKQLFVMAGKGFGLGDYRPGKRGLYGRFKLAEWNVLSGKKAFK